MNNTSRRGGFAALSSGLKSAFQWRLLLWWVLALWLPTLLLAAPLWTGLQAQWGDSVHAPAIAAGRDTSLFADALMSMGDSMAGLSMGAMIAFGLTLLLSPWLTGMVVASMRAGRRLGMGELLHGGLVEYGRMFRMLLWSIIPLGIALAIGMAAMKAADKQAETAILASQVENAARIGLVVLAVLFVFAHMTVEAGRGWLGADTGLRSAFRAWWRGTKLVLRRPLASLIVYLGTSLVGYVLALAFGLWRLNISGVGAAGFVLGIVLTQLIIAMLAWGRIARLYGFADLARDAIARQPVRSPAPKVDNDLSLQPETAIA